MKANCPVHFEGIDHVVLRVTDRVRSLHFYTEILGLHVERIIEDLGLFQVRCGANIIDLIVLPPGKRLADEEARGIDHFCLNIRGDMDVIVGYLKEHNVTITMGPVEVYGATGYGTSVYVLDPDGYHLELKANYSQFPVRTTTTEATNASTRPR
jgi:catechol 2,3-dioxygenase-like lactoylglutathione lyase family enzyme